MDLNGKRVLIVGGSSGIGLATALKAQALGADVAIASRSQARLDDALVRLSGPARSVVLDTGDEDAVSRFFDASEPWTHIVVSAAQTPVGPLRSLPLDQARSAMESKFWGAYRIARSARFDADGSLSLVTGFLSVRPSATSVLQGAINAALEGLVRGLALELSPVRVNAISPGLIDTPLWDRMPEQARSDMFARAASSLPAKRVGTADDIANAAVFLMQTPFATGSTVRVDGGGAIA